MRRRVVTILRNVLVENPQHPYRVKISVALLQRVTDAMEEEDIIKMVLDSFHTIWFDTKVGRRNVGIHADVFPG